MLKPCLMDQVRHCSPRTEKISIQWLWVGPWPLAFGCEQFVDLLQGSFEVLCAVRFEGHTGKIRHAAQFIL